MMQIDLSRLTPAEQRQALALLEEQAWRAERNKLAAYKPYPKQKEFHDAGAEHRERLFLAANQVGKTWAGAYEVAIHASGLYPAWWSGRRFDEPTKWWVAGVTGESTRDNPQRLLVGPPSDKSMFGTAAIPGRLILDTRPARGVVDLLDTVIVQHVTGGKSYIAFKAYEKGREKWQGETLDGIWFDEECPMEIYTEGLTRTNSRNGMVFMTFTPLLGMSQVVLMFLDGDSVARMK